MLFAPTQINPSVKDGKRFSQKKNALCLEGFSLPLGGKVTKRCA
ncbi:hypothetical protein BFO_3262 [Tannerella forsythia 92A2]|uniref:Uncharacterized protein n=1 Tax=Tannerella forsythia (strain ATCC 43037 / JCM 10827 / CCUG 21028 A / KCTC 5666 / FDC 338) TaxID=203275 RepID=G8UIR4_TANFA|nr:hypothetical protein BFO_3262 [Tannerella forsythia 92A2]